MTETYLAGRKVLVTGGASGIGLSIAQHFSSLGAELVLSDLPGEALQRAVQSVPNARMLPSDLTTREGAQALAIEAGAIDILINNAGFQRVSPVESFDPDTWDRILAVMLTAPFLLIRQLIPGMYERRWGRIINIASVHGLIASPFKSAYVSAKHGLLGLTKTVALEAGTHPGSLSVNAICPSYVRTPLVEKQLADQAKVHGIPESKVLESILLTQNAVKRLIEPEEVAKCAAFLCREESWSITGAALTMDAGWLAH